MPLESFWRLTPRIWSAWWRGYLERRAWAAFHAGAPGLFRDVTLDDLRPAPSGARAPRSRKSDNSDETIMLHNARLWKAVLNPQSERA